jgi:LmbE family N-acetylglucosaminyl deacetylase
MRWIYISPHLDDAVLSAGGLIYEQTRSGAQVEIWTILAGVPEGNKLSNFAQVMHKLWGTSSAEETVRVRRAEDVNAADLLSAKTCHFDFLDCLYRRGRNGDWLYPDVYLPPHRDDADIPRQIADAIASRLLPDDILICPLALGSHVDHVLVRQALEMLDCPLHYYADIPYLFHNPDSLSPITVGMKENEYAVTEAGLRSWQDAVNAYSSQLSTLFDSPEELLNAIRHYCEKQDGIRLWTMIRQL